MKLWTTKNEPETFVQVRGKRSCDRHASDLKGRQFQGVSNSNPIHPNFRGVWYISFDNYLLHNTKVHMRKFVVLQPVISTRKCAFLAVFQCRIITKLHLGFRVPFYFLAEKWIHQLWSLNMMERTRTDRRSFGNREKYSQISGDDCSITQSEIASVQSIERAKIGAIPIELWEEFETTLRENSG